MTINEIIAKYTNCEATLDETNEALKEMQAGFHLEPNRNEIKPEEEEYFGRLNDGFGADEKVRVIKNENGIRLEKAVFNPESFAGCALPVYEVEYKGVWYKVANDGFTLE